MTFLPHASEFDRVNLILKEQTLLELGVDPDLLGRHSSVEIYFQCVVCSEAHKLSKKRILDGKGLTHPGECRTTFKKAGGQRARKNEDPKFKELRKIKLREKINKDKDLIVQKRQQTLTAKYGTSKLGDIPEIRDKISQSVKQSASAASIRRQNSNLSKYGNTNYLASKEGLAKVKQHNRENYGVDFPFQSTSMQKKAKDAMESKHGVTNPALLPETHLKRTQTNLERYGVENPRQNTEIQKLIETTCIEKYGTSWSTSAPLVREKMKQTFLEKYGVDNPWKVPSIRKGILNTMTDKYGVEYYYQLPTEKNKLKEWCEKNPEKLFCSKGEQEILDWVRQFYPSACKFRKDLYELDIYIPEIKLGIEYNGLFWHSESCKPRNYHLDKTKFFEQQGIRVIHIFEHEWKLRKEQVKSFLTSALKANLFRIRLNKCAIIWSSSSDEIAKAHSLLEVTHIQGASQSTKYVANVYHNSQLVATATFGRHHRNSVDWVLSRFTTQHNYTIPGLLSKISKLAVDNLKQDIISWADYRISSGAGYEKANWIRQELLPPDYFYIKITTGAIISKQSRQKKLINTPLNMTEREHALQDGLDRVWDCGKIRYIFKY